MQVVNLKIYLFFKYVGKHEDFFAIKGNGITDLIL